MEKTLSAISGALFAAFSFCFGGADKILLTLLAMMLIDYISGVIYAISQKMLSSKIGFKGIAKKMLILLIVTAANLCDNYIIGNGYMLRSAAIGFYTANEAISLLENAALLGIPLPRKLVGVLAQLKDEEKDKACKDDGASNKA